LNFNTAFDAVWMICFINIKTICKLDISVYVWREKCICRLLTEIISVVSKITYVSKQSLILSALCKIKFKLCTMTEKHTSAKHAKHKRTPNLKMAVFWVVAPFCLVEVYWHFRGSRWLSSGQWEIITTLMMEATSTSETSVNFSTRLHSATTKKTAISILATYENLKSYSQFGFGI
jgi:hypothetical protein